MCATATWAQSDARIAFLSRQLKSAKDPRARAQTAIILGASQDARAVAPLCGALADIEPLVRVAAANALGGLPVATALACLEQRRNDPDAEVAAAITRALGQLSTSLSRRSAVYVALEVANAGSSLTREDMGQVESRLRDKLVSAGAILAPAHETHAEAQKVLQERQVKGYLLMTEVLPNGSSGFKLKLLCMTYPERALRGQVSVKGSGPMSKLIPALVSRAVDDSAHECGWSE